MQTWETNAKENSPSERVVVFIDGSNLYHILKNKFGLTNNLEEFDYAGFCELLTEKRQLIEIRYYSAKLDINKNREKYSKQQSFFDKLSKQPQFKVILCRMQKSKENGKLIYKVKEDDIHIAVDIVSGAYENNYDTAILVSTDGDFVPAVEKAKQRMKKVENIGFENKFSWHLKQKCSKFRVIKNEELKTLFH